MVLQSIKYDGTESRVIVVASERLKVRNLDKFEGMIDRGFMFDDMLAADSYCQKLGLHFPSKDYNILANKYFETYPVELIIHAQNGNELKVGDPIIEILGTDHKIPWVAEFVADVFTQKTPNTYSLKTDTVFNSLLSLDEHVMEFGMPEDMSKIQIKPVYDPRVKTYIQRG